MVLLSEDYYVDSETGLMVLTEKFHIKRGYCCGNKCRHCAYEPKYVRGSEKLKNE